MKRAPQQLDKHEGQNQSTTTIINLLRKNNKLNNHQSVEVENDQSIPSSPNSINQVQPFHTKSYRPKGPPTFTEEEKQKFAENARHIRTDGENLLFDEKRQMYYYPPLNTSNKSEPPQISSETESVEERDDYGSRIIVAGNSYCRT